jgi:hypothetical protein
MGLEQGEGLCVSLGSVPQIKIVYTLAECLIVRIPLYYLIKDLRPASEIPLELVDLLVR